MEFAKGAQRSWAKTPLWKRAELLHKAASILKEHKAPIADCLVKEIAKPSKDAINEVSGAEMVFFVYNLFSLCFVAEKVGRKGLFLKM